MTEPDGADAALAARVKASLSSLPDPFGGGDIVASERVESVLARGGLVQITLRSSRTERETIEATGRQAEQLASSLPGVTNATVILTSHRTEPNAKPGPEASRAPGRPKLLADVRHVIAVASGKGGVGKSTVAVNLAVCLSRLGLRVGMIDADIHGPSLPRMLGLDRKPEVRGDRMIPLQAWGITAMSIGFLVPETQAMIWRGPMVMGALEQLMGQVDWPPLDVMVIDMPPGTGDAQLTLAQRVDLAGAVIVSTPQDIALIDARRGIDMFGRTGVPILGLVENMSVFCCPNCGHRTAIFGEGGVEREAAKLGMIFLGAVPLLPAIRNAGDIGAPVSSVDRESEAGRAFQQVAEAVKAQLK